MTDSVLFVGADPRESTGFLSHWQRGPAHRVTGALGANGQMERPRSPRQDNGAGAGRAFAAVPGRTEILGHLQYRPLRRARTKLWNRIGDVFVATEVRNGTRSWPVRQPDGTSRRSDTLAS